MRSMCVGVAETGVEHRSPARYLRKLFFIVLFNDEKYQKSFKRAFLPLKKLLPRARVSRASRAWRVRAAQGKAKTDSLTALRGFNYTTRANISHERAEQIRARIACTPAYKGAAGIDTYAKHVCRRRRDGASWGKCLR